MRKLLATTALAAAVLAACGGGGGGGDGGDRASRSDRPASTTTTAPAGTTTTTAPSTTATTAAPAAPATPSGPSTTAPDPAPAPPGTTTTVPAEPASDRGTGTRYVCPEGDIEDVRALQRSVDRGHQPWRLSAEAVAAACTYPTGAVELAGEFTYRVVDPATGDTAVVQLARPLGPGTIWVATFVALP
jgi:hypothetical protein